MLETVSIILQLYYHSLNEGLSCISAYMYVPPPPHLMIIALYINTKLLMNVIYGGIMNENIICL